MERIERERCIRMGARGAVFSESARRPPLAPRDVEARYRIGRGRGRDYVEVEIPRSWIERRVNGVTGAEEWLVHRDIPLGQGARIVRRH
jgi:hypothetical protein